MEANGLEFASTFEEDRSSFASMVLTLTQQLSFEVELMHWADMD